MRRALAPVATLSLALTLGLAPDIAAAGTRASSTVTITQAESGEDGTTIKGRVTSSKSSCKKGRSVSVYHDVAPPGPSADDFLLGTAETNKRGRWRLTTSHAPDKVYAKVSGNQNCKKDTSGTTTVTS